MTPLPSSAEPLARALRAVGQLIDGIQREQWAAPTPCTDWTVRELVAHLVGMNLASAALLDDQPPPQRGVDRLGDDPAGAYLSSGAAMQAAFDRPGVPAQTVSGDAPAIDRLAAFPGRPVSRRMNA